VIKNPPLDGDFLLPSPLMGEGGGEGGGSDAPTSILPRDGGGREEIAPQK